MEEDSHARVTLRIPRDLQKMIEDSAHERTRSMNAEIVQRLTDSFSQDDTAETLREALVSVHRMASISATMPTLMAKLFRDVLDQLSPEVQSKINGIDEARALANALLHEDPELMFDALAALLLKHEDIEPTRQLVRADSRVAEELGLQLRTPGQRDAQAKAAAAARLTDAAIIRRAPKQPMLSQGPRPRKR